MTKKKTTKQVRAIDRIIKFQIDDGIESLTIGGKTDLADLEIDSKQNVTLHLNADGDKLNEINSLVPFITIKQKATGKDPDKKKTVELIQDLREFAIELTKDSEQLATIIKEESSIIIDFDLLIKRINNLVGLISTAQRTADTAQRTAERAEGKADTAQVTADRAEGKADTAQEKADTAQVTANRAEGKADIAQEKADTAQVTANRAEGKADTAQEKADTAQATANRAESIAKTLKDLNNEKVNTKKGNANFMFNGKNGANYYYGVNFSSSDFTDLLSNSETFDILFALKYHDYKQSFIISSIDTSTSEEITVNIKQFSDLFGTNKLYVSGDLMGLYAVVYSPKPSLDVSLINLEWRML